MYGSYYEVKFDALGLTLRLEALVNTLFQQLIDELDLGPDHPDHPGSDSRLHAVV